MKVSRSALLPYSASQMYEIVADIRAYPDFLNWCEAIEIIDEQELEVIAKLKISYSKLNIQFTTRNQNIPNERIIMNLVDGPFSSLEGVWLFKKLNSDACKVSIDMQFDFDRSVVPSIFTKVFEKIISMQLDAFQKRAQNIYGKA